MLKKFVLVANETYFHIYPSMLSLTKYMDISSLANWPTDTIGSLADGHMELSGPTAYMFHLQLLITFLFSITSQIDRHAQDPKIDRSCTGVMQIS